MPPVVSHDQAIGGLIVVIIGHPEDEFAVGAAHINGVSAVLQRARGTTTGAGDDCTGLRLGGLDELAAGIGVNLHCTDGGVVDAGAEVDGQAVIYYHDVRHYHIVSGVMADFGV